MVSLNLDPITPRALGGFYRLLGASLLARVLTDISAGIYRVHTGELFPWRHLPVVPLYSPNLLVLEWAAQAAGGLALLLLWRVRDAVILSLLATTMALSQRYSNQTALALIVLSFCALKPVSIQDLSASANPLSADPPNLNLIRYQVLIVYGFSALNKILSGFLNGQALAALLQIPPAMAQASSWLVVGAEIILPLLLVLKKVRLAWCGVVMMHLAFSFLLPGLIPFGLLMIAMTTLWLR